jgi:hypothetical protein
MKTCNQLSFFLFNRLTILLTQKRPNIPLSERKCIFCSTNSVENEIHVLVDCDFFSDLRYVLTENATK